MSKAVLIKGASSGRGSARISRSAVIARSTLGGLRRAKRTEENRRIR
jgi:hypothetical protein